MFEESVTQKRILRFAQNDKVCCKYLTCNHILEFGISDLEFYVQYLRFELDLSLDLDQNCKKMDFGCHLKQNVRVF